MSNSGYGTSYRKYRACVEWARAHNAEPIDYLKTKEWKERRQKVMDRSEGYCERCGWHLSATQVRLPEGWTQEELDAYDKRPKFKPGDKVPMMQIHHKTYDNFGNEPLEDLLGVCFVCHKELADQQRSESHKTTNLLKRQVKQY